MIIREVPLESRRAARDQVEAWGYPRPLTYEEEAFAYWIQSRVGFMWFVQGPREPDHRMVHVCIDPAHRLAAAFDPEHFQLIRIVAGLLGARRVYAPLGPMYPGWAKYLKRMGFDQQDAIGPYFDLED